MNSLRPTAARAATAAEAGLRRTASVFGTVRHQELALPYAALVDVPERAADLPLAIELVYEGYLLHYRQGRALAPELSPETLLLAGDYFYAHGLSLVAQAGDMGAVGLLARLMAVCSHLRVQQAPFAADDSLWELTALAVGAGDGPCRAAAAGAYDRIDDLIAAGRTDDLAPAGLAGLAAVRACAARIQEA